ncbi:glycosyltransferase family 4 protein [Flavobacterium sp.]|uniref:glycosyltransferase family 4 protein n=1 Tax=Flavobacterium sp. TaxID=239 RepID=UPI002CC2BBD8|nr:glycosyltransferase family 4 protein [Flavobacterium sp.]HSD07322.1 glycosyltransferase family 4 protein [Flavobacterium sp.]
MKKILIIHHGIGVGGGLIALLGLIEEIKKKNEVRVLSLFNSEAVEYIKKTGVEVYLPKSKFYSKFYRLFIHSEASYFSVIEFLESFKNILMFFLNQFFFAKRELKSLDFDYDIVYLNSTFISEWSMASKKLGKKTIIHVREPLAKGFLGIRKAIIRNVIKQYCDRIIAISYDNAERVDLRNITTVVYDPVVFKGRHTSIKILPDPKYKYFLYLGGMQRIKGFEQFVKSLSNINDDVRIYFLGGDYIHSGNKMKRIISIIDPYMWRINSLIARLNQSDKIIKIGLVDNIFDYYSSSIALISPFSKPHASLPILEAFSIGKPVIVSDIEGMSEIVSVQNGFFFKNNNYKELAIVINKIAKLDSIQYQIISENAKRKYDEILGKNASVQFVIDGI